MLACVIRSRALPLLLALTACGPATSDVLPPSPRPPAPPASPSAAPAPAVRIAFEVPRNGAPPDLLRTPWPTELARLPDGHLDFRAYPGRDSALFSEYLARATEDLDGFSVAPVVYFRFEGPIDLASLPAQETSRSASAAIALVDVDSASPEKGTFYPLALHATSRDMRYVRAGTLAVRPLDGFVLRPGTLYATVVLRSFGAVYGGLQSSPDLEAVVSRTARADATEERARALHAPALDTLETLGVKRAEVAAIAVFRTHSPHLMSAKMIQVIDTLFGGPQAPRVVTAEWDPGRSIAGLYRVLRGTYCTPNFQAKIENAPFIEREGGRVLAGSDGRPLVAPVPHGGPPVKSECPDQLRARFVLSVPDAPTPKDGFPLLVTAHGTGGDAFTFLHREDFAGWAATEGFAAISTDQPLNGGKDGGRPGAAGPLVLPLRIPVPPDRGGPSLAFYNPIYPGAARGNLQQAAADAAVLVRLFGGLDFAALRTPANQPVLGSRPASLAPRFDRSRTVLAGHSQGCQSLAALGAIDPRPRGVVLSGCGGDVRLGVLHRRVLALAPWVSMVMGLDPEELSESHPLFALLQNLADPIDPIAFARHYWDPLPGMAQQRVLHFEGLRDGYNPEVASEALAIALRAQPRLPLIKPIPGLALLNGKLSADRQIAQYAPHGGRDGHFVLYHEAGASDDFRAFLRESGAAPKSHP